MPAEALTWDDAPGGEALRWDDDDPSMTWDGTLPTPPNPNPNPKKNMQLRVLLGFASASDHGLEERARAVSNQLYTGLAATIYTSPSVTKVNLDAGIEDFSASIATAATGGEEDTAAKDNKRAALIADLRKLANDVQKGHQNNLEWLLSSGFEAVSTNSASSPLDTPDILDIIHGISGELKLRVTRIRNARVYEVRYALLDANGAPGPWQDGGLHSNSRSQSIGGLTPGAMYQFQVRAVGGSTGYSDWSNIVSHRSM